MKLFTYFWRIFTGSQRPASCQADCSKKKSIELSEDSKPPLPVAEIVSAGPKISDINTGNITLLACPFCGQGYVWDSATIRTDRKTFQTDKTCAVPGCEDVKLSYICLCPGSLALSYHSTNLLPQ